MRIVRHASITIVVLEGALTLGNIRKTYQFRNARCASHERIDGCQFEIQSILISAIHIIYILYISVFNYCKKYISLIDIILSCFYSDFH